MEWESLSTKGWGAAEMERYFHHVMENTICRGRLRITLQVKLS